MTKIIKRSVIIIFIFIFIILGLGIYKFNFTDDDIYFACTEDTLVCSDGSTTRRNGKNCEFELCPKINSILSEAEARLIAEKSCIKGGESLTRGDYNSETKTWWYDANLNATREGCSSACVVSEETKIAEVNWRCNDLINISKDIINNDSYGRYISAGCKIATGCNGPIECINEDLELGGSICIALPEYSCYKQNTSKCEKQISGQCGWTKTSELLSCINDYSNNKLLIEGEKCGENIGSCGLGLKCAYPCGIPGCQNICMPENELPRP
jgi:hypothetical protein